MFFNSGNGQRHLVRYFRHGFFVNAAKNEDAAALGRQRIDDRLDLAKCFARMQLRFDIIVALQQLRVGDRFKAHHLVAAGGVDDEIAGNGEEIGAAGGDVFPVLRRIGAGQNLRDHIVQLMRGRQYAAQTTTQCRLMGQYDRLEPFQLGANPLHVDPLVLSAVPLRHLFFL